MDSDNSNDDDMDVCILAYLLLDSDKQHGGSIRGKKKNRYFGYHGAADQFMLDYLGDNPFFTDEEFRRRYRISKTIFVQIVTAVEAFDHWFVRKRDACGRLGISGFMKVAAALSILGNGTSFDRCVSEYRMSESTISDCLHHFCSAIVSIYFEKVVTYPTDAEAQTECNLNEKRGFPGCIGSIDCQNWRWNMCPVSYHGHYTGKDGHPTVKLEAVCTHDLYVWHIFSATQAPATISLQ